MPRGGQAGTEGLCASHQRWEQDGTTLPCPPDGSGHLGERLDSGLQQNTHLHLFTDPWPAVPRGHGHTRTFCLCSLCLCPRKSPMLLQETAREFPEAEHAHLPGTATWNREQGFCKPVLGHRQAQARPSLWLGHLLLKHLCCLGCGGLRRRVQLLPPARRGLTAAHPHQTVPWHQMLFPRGPRMWHSRPPQHFPGKGKEDGWKGMGAAKRLLRSNGEVPTDTKEQGVKPLSNYTA